MIPFLIAPAYNRHDLLLRLLKSIDAPVRGGLILDNGRNLASDPAYLPILEQAELLNLRVFTPPYASLGYGGGINFSILQAADEPWWLWASNDVEFLPETLDRVSELMESASGPRVVTSGFTWGALNAETVEAVGLIDEHSFHPIYYDDNDFERRCRLAGVEWVEYDSNGTRHGDGDHAASLTINSQEDSRKANSRSFPLNSLAYLAKWGGLPSEEQFTSPWNSGVPLWTTKPSVLSRRRRQW